MQASNTTVICVSELRVNVRSYVNPMNCVSCTPSVYQARRVYVPCSVPVHLSRNVTCCEVCDEFVRDNSWYVQLIATGLGAAGPRVVVAVGVSVTVAVAVGVLELVAVGVGVSVLLLVAVGVALFVLVEIAVEVAVAVRVPVGVAVAVPVGVGVGVFPPTTTSNFGLSSVISVRLPSLS